MAFQNVSIKQIQEFWDQRPCNIRHSMAKIGTKRYFDEVGKRRYFVEPHIIEFAEFSKWKGKNVLELGCGIGTDTISFAKAGAKVTAVEVSKKSLDLAKKRAKVYKLERKIKFYLADIEQLSKVVPKRSYDLIYSFGVVHHTPHPERVIEEIKKYMDKNTIIKLMIYYRYSFKVLWILLKFGGNIAKHSEAATGSPVTYIYSKSQARKLLKDFKILEMRIDHIFFYSIPEYIKHRYKIVWYFRYLPKGVFNFLKSHFGWHLLITAKLKQDSWEF